MGPLHHAPPLLVSKVGVNRDVWFNSEAVLHVHMYMYKCTCTVHVMVYDSISVLCYCFTEFAAMDSLCCTLLSCAVY